MSEQRITEALQRLSGISLKDQVYNLGRFTSMVYVRKLQIHQTARHADQHAL